MKAVFLDAKTLGDDIDLSPIEKVCDPEVFETTTKEQLHSRIEGANIIITNKVVIDNEALDHAKALKLICVAATGMNNIDLQSAKERGITVKNVKGYSTESVAQHTFAMLFYLLHQLRYYDTYVKEGGWSKSDIFTHIQKPFWEIAVKRWGIIGLGAIGKAVAKIATAFGANVVYHSTSGNNLDAPYTHLPLERLLSTCDIVSIHAPLNAHTQNLIDKEKLALLKKGAILLNLGRGGIVNESALAQAIDTQEIYAALDVTEREPTESHSALLSLSHPERLLITPHIAWTSIEARKALVGTIAGHIQSFLSQTRP